MLPFLQMFDRDVLTHVSPACRDFYRRDVGELWSWDDLVAGLEIFEWGCQLTMDQWHEVPTGRGSVLNQAIFRRGQPAMADITHAVNAKGDPSHLPLAMRTNNLAMMEWSLLHGYAIDPEMLVIAATAGDIPTLDWLLAHYSRRPVEIPKDFRAVREAVFAGHLPAVAWLFRNGWPFNLFFIQSDRILKAAAESGHVGIAQWLIDNVPAVGPPTAILFKEAVFSGKVRMMQWVHRQGLTPDHTTFKKAIKQGNLDVLIWLKDGGFLARWRHPTHDSTAAGIAADYGHLEILQWLIHNGWGWGHSPKGVSDEFVLRWLDTCPGCPWVYQPQTEAEWVRLTFLAAKCNSRGLLDWISETNAGVWDNISRHWMSGVFTCTALGHGHLATAQYLHQAGFLLDQGSSGPANHLAQAIAVEASHDNITLRATALEQGLEVSHLQTVRWLVEDCKQEWRAKHSQRAAREGYLQILRWAYARGLELPSTVLKIAAHNGHLHVVRWVYQTLHNQQPVDIMAVATEHPDGNMLRWAQAAGHPWTPEARSSLVRNCQRGLICWAMDHGFAWDNNTRNLMDLCKHDSHPDTRPTVYWAHAMGYDRAQQDLL
jgi:hypothetical protein